MAYVYMAYLYQLICSFRDFEQGCRCLGKLTSQKLCEACGDANVRAQRLNALFTCALDRGRGERIRTSGLYVPNVALYQAKLHPAFLI